MSTGTVRVSVFGKTDLGRTRDHNEDTFLVADLTTGQAVSSLAAAEHVIGPRGSLFMVADGMGGAAAGELASSMAAQVIFEHLSTEWRNDKDGSGERFAFRMREAVDRANAEIHAYAQQHPDVRGMGTTLTAAGVFGVRVALLSGNTNTLPVSIQFDADTTLHPQTLTVTRSVNTVVKPHSAGSGVGLFQPNHVGL